MVLPSKNAQSCVADPAETVTSSLCFPPNFLWGVSTAAHQVEGGNDNNQWSAWEAAGRIKSGDRCGRACDWWVDAERDFDLARDIGVNALRLSVEWSRIEPEEGRWDSTAIQRYREMLQALHERGIQPMVCLHHFTHPLWFEKKAGFLGTDASRLFERFTHHVDSFPEARRAEEQRRHAPRSEPDAQRGDAIGEPDLRGAESGAEMDADPRRSTPRIMCSLKSWSAKKRGRLIASPVGEKGGPICPLPRNTL